MKWLTIASVTAAVTGIALGIGISVFVLRTWPEKVMSRLDTTLQETTVATPQTTPQDTIVPEAALDIAYGSLSDRIRQQEGQFLRDHYALSSMIITTQESVGLLRTITENNVDPSIRKIAEELYARYDTDVTELLLQQKLLGHSHH